MPSFLSLPPFDALDIFFDGKSEPSISVDFEFPKFAAPLDGSGLLGLEDYCSDDYDTTYTDLPDFASEFSEPCCLGLEIYSSLESEIDDIEISSCLRRDIAQAIGSYANSCTSDASAADGRGVSEHDLDNDAAEDWSDAIIALEICDLLDQEQSALSSSPSPELVFTQRHIPAGAAISPPTDLERQLNDASTEQPKKQHQIFEASHVDEVVQDFGYVQHLVEKHDADASSRSSSPGVLKDTSDSESERCDSPNTDVENFKLNKKAQLLSLEQLPSALAKPKQDVDVCKPSIEDQAKGEDVLELGNTPTHADCAVHEKEQVDKEQVDKEQVDKEQVDKEQVDKEQVDKEQATLPEVVNETETVLQSAPIKQPKDEEAPIRGKFDFNWADDCWDDDDDLDSIAVPPAREAHANVEPPRGIGLTVEVIGTEEELLEQNSTTFDNNTIGQTVLQKLDDAAWEQEESSNDQAFEAVEKNTPDALEYYEGTTEDEPWGLDPGFQDWLEETVCYYIKRVGWITCSIDEGQYQNRRELARLEADCTVANIFINRIYDVLDSPAQDPWICMIVNFLNDYLHPRSPVQLTINECEKELTAGQPRPRFQVAAKAAYFDGRRTLRLEGVKEISNRKQEVEEPGLKDTLVTLSKCEEKLFSHPTLKWWRCSPSRLRACSTIV